MFQVDLSEVERVRAGSDRTGPWSFLVARGLLPGGPGASTCVARGFLPVCQGLRTVWPGVFYLEAQGLLPVWPGAFYSCGQGSSTSRGGLRKSTTVSSQCHCLSLGRYEDEDMKAKV